jgi:flagellar protein FlaG
MALEPINTTMTLQAQTYAPNATGSNSSTKTAAEYTDVSIAEKAPKVDDTTKVVEPAEEKDGSKSKYEEQQPTNETIQQAVEKLNKKMQNSEAIYGIHEGTNRVTIKIVDRETKKVIKELPPEKTLDMIAKVWEIAGIMVDEFR